MAIPINPNSHNNGQNARGGGLPTSNPMMNRNQQNNISNPFSDENEDFIETKKPIINPFDSEDDETFTPYIKEEKEEKVEQKPFVYESLEEKISPPVIETPKIEETPRVESPLIPNFHNFEEEVKRNDPVTNISQSNHFNDETPISKNSIPKREIPQKNTFIDKENKKLEPFGGKNRKKIKVNDYDNRKNLRQKAKLIQTIIILLLVALVGFGIKTVIFPSQSISQDQVLALINSQTSERFPIDRGSGFAKDFMQSYLSINNNSVDSEVLAYYFSGSDGRSYDSSNKVSYARNFNQEILYGPTIYDSSILSSSSASYTVAVLVSKTSAEKSIPTVDEFGNEIVNTQDPDTQWLYFNVNVYYDEKANTMSITPDSPTLLPDLRIQGTSEVPDSKALGNGKTSSELNNQVRSVVIGYMNGYAVSTVNNHQQLDQYVVPSPSLDLLAGMGGNLSLDENNIAYTSYYTDDPSVIKVKVDVKWEDKNASSDSILYSSSYVMTLNVQADGTYRVSKFAPFYYVPEDSAS